MKPGRIRLLPEALLSVPVFGLSFLWVALVQIGEWAALGDAPGNLALRLVLSLAGHVVMFAFPFITLRVLSPRVSAPSRTWLLLLSVVLGAAVRGIVLGVLFTLTGVTASPEFVFRVIASISHLAVIVVILWFLVSEVRGLHARRYQLITERDQLLVLQQGAQHDLERLGVRTCEEIRSAILESLDGLRATNSTALRERLHVTIEDVVRPLSHQLAAQPAAWVPPQTPPQTMGVDWPLAIREGLNPVRIHPIIVPVLLVWLGLPIHLFQYGPTRTAGLVAALIVAVPAFWLARRVAIRLTFGFGSGAKAAAFVVAVIIGGIALGLATLPYMQGQPQPFLFVVVAPLLALLISGPLAIAEAARDQDRELEADLATTTADLRWALARTREQFRQQDSALAHALHGRLQASLAAASLRLDRAVAQGVDDEALLDALQSEIREAVSKLDEIDAIPDPTDKVIELTQRNWSGAVDITCSLDARICDALGADPLCARAVNDLIPELVFNSVRHGDASMIDVSLELTDQRTLSLTVTDNGSGALIATRYGLGSTLLDEASMTWSRTRIGDSTTTTCLLPWLNSKAPVVIP
jgi:signal transduction histidine kinase